MTQLLSRRGTVAVGMPDDLELFTAAFFRVSGKDVMTPEEFVTGVSLKQKWMAPGAAKALLSKLIMEGVVESKGGYVRPTGDLSGIEVPLAYRPPKDILEAPAGEVPAQHNADAFQGLVAAAEAAGIDRGEFIQRSRQVSKRLDVEMCAAALIALRESGVDASGHADAVYGEIRIAPSSRSSRGSWSRSGLRPRRRPTGRAPSA